MASAPQRPPGGRRRRPKSRGPSTGGKNPAPATSIFENCRYFPPFKDLPYEHSLDERYLVFSSDRGMATYSHTWCFLGEITNDDTAQCSFLRNGVWVRDRVGRDDVFVAFYPDQGHFDFHTLKKGHTICVLFAEEHIFLDGKVGLRIEDLDTVKVIPCGLDQVLALGKQYFENQDSCWGCGRKGSSSPASCSEAQPTPEQECTPPTKLLRCCRCVTAAYCNKDCQTKDWKARHRHWCKAIPVFCKVAAIDYATYSKSSCF